MEHSDKNVVNVSVYSRPGAGKSTIMHIIYEALKAHGIEAKVNYLDMMPSWERLENFKNSLDVVKEKSMVSIVEHQGYYSDGK